SHRQCKVERERRAKPLLLSLRRYESQTRRRQHANTRNAQVLATLAVSLYIIAFEEDAMNKQGKGFSRRELLEMAIGAGGLTLYGDTASAFAPLPTEPVFTPSIILGPFYPQIKLSEQDPDLTVLAGRQKRAAGEVVYLTGRVLNLKGKPVSGAKISIWQANSHGRYSHKSDQNTAPLDPNFQGYGLQTTDAEGRYRFKTIKPGAYPAPVVGMRAPHIHFEVEAKYDG